MQAGDEHLSHVRPGKNTELCPQHPALLPPVQLHVFALEITFYLESIKRVQSPSSATVCQAADLAGAQRHTELCGKAWQRLSEVESVLQMKLTPLFTYKFIYIQSEVSVNPKSLWQ